VEHGDGFLTTRLSYRRQQLGLRRTAEEPADGLRVWYRLGQSANESGKDLLAPLGDARPREVAGPGLHLLQLDPVLVERQAEADPAHHAQHRPDGREPPPRQLGEPGKQDADARRHRPRPRARAHHQPDDDGEAGERDVPAAERAVEPQQPQHD
jgi:hypothetical protein